LFWKKINPVITRGPAIISPRSIIETPPTYDDYPGPSHFLPSVPDDEEESEIFDDDDLEESEEAQRMLERFRNIRSDFLGPQQDLFNMDYDYDDLDDEDDDDGEYSGGYNDF